MTKVNSDYYYTESGLDSIYLVNGFEFVDSPRGRSVVIQDIDGLHDMIGTILINERKDLSGKELRFLRQEMAMSQDTLANLLGVSDQSIRNWEREKTAGITSTAQSVVRLLYQEHLGGNEKIKGSLKRIADLEEEIDHRLTLEATNKGWQAKEAA
jgi:DNA-binding transcriptional regulator YiaG